jgi:excinuclease UvrABC ATPase subunit
MTPATEPPPIRIRGARENNLRDVDLDIPKHRLTVVTGVSGSGKSSLVFDVLAAESGRQLNATFSAFAQTRLPDYGEPDADALENLPAVIVVDQRRITGGPRSTVGTATDIGARMRLLFSRVATPPAGHSPAYGFNDPAGMCPACQGLGVAAAIDVGELVDADRSLAEGAITFPPFAPGQWLWKAYARSGFFDPAKPVRDYTPAERDLLLHTPAKTVAPPAGMDAVGTAYEGLIPRFTRLYLNREPESFKGAQRAAFERIVTRGRCPECAGTRLAAPARAARVGGLSIADANALPIDDLSAFVRGLHHPEVAPLLRALRGHLERMVDLGLGYLSLDRATGTLSGGEAQRVKTARHLGSALTDMLYVFDEPTVGLHPRDVHRLGAMLRALRDRGNTVVVVEHDPAIMAIADHCVDMGPGAGAAGGRVCYTGPFDGLRRADTPTGAGLRAARQARSRPRTPTGWIAITHARTNNLRDVSVRVPRGVLTAVTGVAGSGKSSLIHGHLPVAEPGTVVIDQRPIRGSRRSSPATYTGLLDTVRTAFARATGRPAGLFSPNSTGGCPACEGSGVIYTDLAFMDGVATRCEACEGRRFTEEAQRHTLDGRSIADVLEMNAEEARGLFTRGAARAVLDRLCDVGLGYVPLGRPLTTLSGGERQRLKLAAELADPGRTLVLDEPTTGLHLADTARLLGLVDRLVDGGATVVVIEHDLDVVAAADWVIDVGPEAGRGGGRVVFTGTPEELAARGDTHTAEHLRRHRSGR